MGPSRRSECKSHIAFFAAGIAAMLACLFMLSVLGWQQAFADDAPQLSVAPQDAQETEDFGIYYRIGDNYYKKSTGELALQRWKDGCVYHIAQINGWESYDYIGIIGVCEKFYTNGYLLYDCGAHYNMEYYKAGSKLRLWIGATYPWDATIEEKSFSKPWPRDPASFGRQNLWNRYSHIAVIVSDGDTEYYPDTYIREGLIRVVRFDDRLFKSRDELISRPGARECGFWDGFNPEYIDHWFDGLYNLQRLENLERLDTSKAKSMAYLFNGCSSLRELDMSGWDTSNCIDFTGMFNGCDALEKLTFGPGWTQAGANSRAPVVRVLGQDYAGYKVGKATFPVDMLDEFDVFHPAGEVIPDGEGVYTTCRTNIATRGTVRLLRPGSLVVDAAAKAAYDEAPETLPAGVEPNEVYSFEDVLADEGNSALTCVYTGKKVVPTAVLCVDGVRLREGRDFTVDAVCDSDSWEGRATAIVSGIGDYYGAFVVPFTIKDMTVHAFLFEDGLLYIKEGRDYPPPSTVGNISYTGMNDLVWFNAFTYQAGSVVPWEGHRTRIKRVVFDRSLANYAPETMAGWFDGCTALTEVSDLYNVKTTSVISMANMFRGCTSLEALDLSAISTKGVTDMSGLLDGCTGLRTLYTGFKWSTAAAVAAGAAPVMPAACYRMSPSEAPFSAGAIIPSGMGEYRFGDIAMQFVTSVVMEKDSFTCTGKPIEPKFEVMMGSVTLKEGRDYIVGYSNNVYPGNARAVILGTGLFSGGLAVPFKIVARVTKVGDRLTYKTKTATYELTVTSVKKKNGRVVSVTTEVTGIVVASASTKTLTLPSECTIGGVSVTVNAVGSKLKGKFRNVACVVVGPKVTTIGARAFAKAPKVKKLKIRSKRLTKVKNCLAGSNVTKVTTDCVLSNTKRLTYQKWFMKQSGKKGVVFVYMIPR